MKKLSIIILLITFLSITGCKKDETKISDSFKEIFESYDFNNTNGYNYTSIQKINEVIVNSSEITVRVNFEKKKLLYMKKP